MQAKGSTISEIAAHFHVSLASAHGWIVRELNALPKQATEDLLRLELKKLDKVDSSINEIFSAGEVRGDQLLI
jgi:hypothetical protein